MVTFLNPYGASKFTNTVPQIYLRSSCWLLSLFNSDIFTSRNSFNLFQTNHGFKSRDLEPACNSLERLNLSDGQLIKKEEVSKAIYQP